MSCFFGSRKGFARSGILLLALLIASRFIGFSSEISRIVMPDSVVVASTDNAHAVNQPEQVEEGGHEANLAPLLFIVVALFVGAATRHLLRKGPLPYTISLLIVGLILGILARSAVFVDIGLSGFSRSIEWAGNINPHLILYLFLPTLIFEAAFALHIHTFKKSLGNAVILAIPGLLVAMMITASIVMLINHTGLGLQSWSWLFALMFGAIISATDPVAVVAVLKEVGASKKLSTITESESMLNDGTAIVVFMTFFALITGTGSDDNVLLEFLRVALGGALVGGAIAWAVIFWLKRVLNDALIEITLIISAAYLSFFMAENVLHVSGVIAVVAFGISMAGPGRTRISPDVSHFLHEFWELAAYIANTLIFIIVGVIIAQQVSYSLSDLLVLLLVYIGIHIARLGAIYLFYPLMKRIGYGISFRDSIVLWWGGLRGAVALALAIIVAIEQAIPSAIRSDVLSLVAGIVVLTSLINATTIKWLIDKLGLSKQNEVKRGLYKQSLQQIGLSCDKVIDKLRKNRFFADAQWDIVEEYIVARKGGGELERVEVNPEEALAETRKRLLQKEKESYWRQFGEGMLSSDGVQLLSDQIDALLDRKGLVPLSDRDDIEQLWHVPRITATLQGLPLLGVFWKQRFANRLAIGYDCAHAFVSAQEENLKSLSSLLIGFSLNGDSSEAETEMLSQLEDELNENRITGLTFLRNLRESYPDICTAIETHLASRFVLNHQKEVALRLRKQGRLEPDDMDSFESKINLSMKRLLASSFVGRNLNDPAHWLVSFNAFSNLPKKELSGLTAGAQFKMYPAGSRVCKRSGTYDGILLVVNGSARFEGPDGVQGVVDAGSAIGAYEWLHGLKRRYDVTAETPLSVVRIPAGLIDKLTRESQPFVRAVERIAAYEIAFELLLSDDHYKGNSSRRLRMLIAKGELIYMERAEKYHLEGVRTIVVKGSVVPDERDTSLIAPALTREVDLRCENESAIVLVIP